MVKGVRLWLGIWVLGCWSSLTWAAPEVSIYPQKVRLGEPVTLLLVGHQVERAFEQLDLHPLYRQFAVESIEGDADKLRVRLYPTALGRLTIPEMRYGLLHVKPVTIEVVPNPHVEVVWRLPEKSLFVGQLGYWQAEVEVDNPAFLVEQKAPYYPYRPQAEWQGGVEALNESHGLMGDRYVFKSRVMFETSGDYHLHSPGVRVKNETNQRWLFFAPAQTVSVKTLPSYLPIAMPLGQVSIEAQSLPMMLASGSLYEWQLKMTAQDTEQDRLPNLASQLESTQIEWLSPLIETQQTFEAGGLVSSATLTQPFRVANWGWVDMPGLTASFFNPHTQKIEQTRLAPQTLWVLPAPMIWLVQGVLGLLLVLILWAGLRWLKVGFAKAWLVWKLKQAVHPIDVWRALEAWMDGRWTVKTSQARDADLAELTHTDHAEYSTQSIGQWVNQVAARYGASEALMALEEALNQSGYAVSHLETPIEEEALRLKEVALIWARQLPVFQPSVVFRFGQ